MIAPDQIDLPALQAALPQAQMTVETFTAAAGQSAFTLARPLASEPLVLRNGVALDAAAQGAGAATAPGKGEFSWQGATVTLGDKLKAGERVKVVRT